MEHYLLKTEGMAVGYRGVPLIENVTLQVKKGEILTLIGPNGSGKSTILKSLIRQLNLLAGTVYLSGRDMKNMGEREVARSLSILMTERVHPELMTCGDVVATGRYPYTGRLGILSQQDRAVVRESLALVHGEALFDTEFARISDGQRQRVLLARAICQEPDVIVLDEPTSFLDIRFKIELLSILKDLARRRQVAIVMSLHELDLAQRVSDSILCVHHDGIQKYGTPEEIFSGDYIRQLYGVTRGSYNELFGCVELEAAPGEPQVFVIGGGGSGIPVYRRLQRSGIPFAAGILPENDLDTPVARALAAQVVTEKAFFPVGEAAFRQAVEMMGRCRQVICCLSEFGPVNQRNWELAELARRQGKLVPPDEAAAGRREERAGAP